MLNGSKCYWIKKQIEPFHIPLLELRKYSIALRTHSVSTVKFCIQYVSVFSPSFSTVIYSEQICEVPSHSFFISNNLFRKTILSIQVCISILSFSFQFCFITKEKKPTFLEIKLNLWYFRRCCIKKETLYLEAQCCNAVKMNNEIFEHKVSTPT